MFPLGLDVNKNIVKVTLTACKYTLLLFLMRVCQGWPIPTPFGAVPYPPFSPYPPPTAPSVTTTEKPEAEIASAAAPHPHVSGNHSLKQTISRSINILRKVPKVINIQFVNLIVEKIDPTMIGPMQNDEIMVILWALTKLKPNFKIGFLANCKTYEHLLEHYKVAATRCKELESPSKGSHNYRSPCPWPTVQLPIELLRRPRHCA